MPAECGRYVKKQPVMKAERFWVGDEQWPEDVVSKLGRSSSLVHPYVYYCLECNNRVPMSIHHGDWILTNTETGEKRVVYNYVLHRDYKRLEGEF